MSILFAGGEDADFPLGSLPPPDTTAGRFRTGYARCSLGYASGTTAFAAYSQAIAGGPFTSVWIAGRVYVRTISGSGAQVDNIFGMTSSAAPGKGLWIQLLGGTSGRIQLAKFDTSSTVLLAESGASLTAGSIHRLDLQIVNFGASATVRVYADLNLVITYSGSTTISGVTGLDQAALASNSANQTNSSEILVADEDTRSLAVVTLIPNALGTTDQWTGTFTDINEQTLSDATVNTTNVVGQLQQYALSDLPAGNFAMKAVTINARATAPAGSTSNSVQLGVQTGTGTDVGSAQAPGTGLVTLSRVMNTDPTTGGQWTPTTVNGMQLVMKSGA